MSAAPFFVILGTAQDGGYPQAGCRQPCCTVAWAHPDVRRTVACAAIVDPQSHERWMIDATPDFRPQLQALDSVSGTSADRPPPDLAGILLTHGHAGHYTGLLHLGREVIGAKRVPVLATARMIGFLRANEPWRSIEREGHVAFQPIRPGVPIALNGRITVVGVPVPHRDEHTDTLAFRVEGPEAAVLYLPDIDGWSHWSDGGSVAQPASAPDKGLEALAQLLHGVESAYLDGTFFSPREVPRADSELLPHPPIEVTLELLNKLPASVRASVRFIHLNHTNPALDETSAERHSIEASGCRVAEEMEVVGL